MSDISYITANFVKTLADNPSRLVSALEYACVATLLIAIVSDSMLRPRRPTAQNSIIPEDRPKQNDLKRGI